MPECLLSINRRGRTCTRTQDTMLTMMKHHNNNHDDDEVHILILICHSDLYNHCTRNLHTGGIQYLQIWACPLSPRPRLLKYTHCLCVTIAFLIMMFQHFFVMLKPVWSIWLFWFWKNPAPLEKIIQSFDMLCSNSESWQCPWGAAKFQVSTLEPDQLVWIQQFCPVIYLVILYLQVLQFCSLHSLPGLWWCHCIWWVAHLCHTTIRRSLMLGSEWSWPAAWSQMEACVFGACPSIATEVESSQGPLQWPCFWESPQLWSTSWWSSGMLG